MIHKIRGRIELIDPGAAGIVPPRARVYDEQGNFVGDFTLPRKQLGKWRRYVDKDHLLLVLDFDSMTILQVQSAKFHHFVPMVRDLLYQINAENKFRLWFFFSESERQLLDPRTKLWRIPVSTGKDIRPTTSLILVYREDGNHALRAYISIHDEDISREDLIIPLFRLRHWASSPVDKLKNRLQQAYDLLVAAQNLDVRRYVFGAAMKPIRELGGDDAKGLFTAFRAALPSHPLSRDLETFLQSSYLHLCSQLVEALEKTPLVRGNVRKRRCLYRALFALADRLGARLRALLAFLVEDLHGRRPGK